MNKWTKRLGVVAAAAALAAIATSFGSQAGAAPVDPTFKAAAVAPNNSVTGASVVDGSLTGADIKNGSLTGADIKDGSLGKADLAAAYTSTLVTIYNNTVKTNMLTNGAVTTPKIADNAVTIQKLDRLAQVRLNMPTQEDWGNIPAPTVLENVGGSIFGDYNKPTTDPVNQPDKRRGTLLPNVAGMLLNNHSGESWSLGYHLSITGDFEWTTAPADPTVQVQPQLTIWADYDGDKVFEDGEELASPNVTLLSRKGRHGSVSASIPQVSFEHLTGPTTQIYVLAMGYASNDGSNGSGEITLSNMKIGALPVS